MAGRSSAAVTRCIKEAGSTTGRGPSFAASAPWFMFLFERDFFRKPAAAPRAQLGGMVSDQTPAKSVVICQLTYRPSGRRGWSNGRASRQRPTDRGRPRTRYRPRIDDRVAGDDVAFVGRAIADHPIEPIGETGRADRHRHRASQYHGFHLFAPADAGSKRVWRVAKSVPAHNGWSAIVVNWLAQSARSRYSIRCRGLRPFRSAS